MEHLVQDIILWQTGTFRHWESISWSYHGANARFDCGVLMIFCRMNFQGENVW